MDPLRTGAGNSINTRKQTLHTLPGMGRLLCDKPGKEEQDGSILKKN